MDNTQIKKILDFDGLSAAESLTHESYKTDDDTMKLGICLGILNNDLKTKVLEETNDTHMSISVPQACLVWEDLGFQIVLDYIYDGHAHSQEHMYIFWNPEKSILGYMESYNGYARVNNAKIWYNLKFNEDATQQDRWSVVSTGKTTLDGVLVGMHDVREGLRSKIETLESVGTFLTEWVDHDIFIWFVSYMDTKRDDWMEIADERLRALPSYILEKTGLNNEQIH